jgi:hypothetical protein
VLDPSRTYEVVKFYELGFIEFCPDGFLHNFEIWRFQRNFDTFTRRIEIDKTGIIGRFV